MHVTVTNLFPDVVIKSCRFHLGQAWWRKIQALGLAKEYKKSVTDISTCKCIFGANQYRPNV
jgi:hypothetical protein